ncbi:MAG: hypothetical protein JST04_16545 [Bdellovibrionales bacterium]|nr:hypothetical protein [Bdellovibrionales bacterium]
MKSARASLCAAALLLASPFAHAYTGAQNLEATMTFEAKIELDLGRAPTEREARAEVELQVKHLFGAMTNAESPGVPKNDHRIEIVSILPAPKSRDRFEIAYRYAGTVLMKSDRREGFTLYLPTNPHTIAEDAVAENSAGTPNACTDEDDSGPEYFWYFWSPEREGCRLVEGRDYLKVTATVAPKNEARDPVKDPTFPEYERLAQTRGGKKVIPISVLIGKFESSASGKPLRSRDEGAQQFAKMRGQLLAMGFAESEITKKEIKAIAKLAKEHGELERANVGGYPFARLFSKETREGTMEVRLYYGDSSDQGAKGFFILYQDALQHDAVVIYDGHSGLGDYLSLANLKRDRGISPAADPSIYQIFYFNSCTSYAYYNDAYFRWKASATDPRGTKQLDIITNGLATGYTTQDTNMVLVKAVHAWATEGRRANYTELANLLELENLTGVNGDEDNPRR